MKSVLVFLALALCLAAPRAQAFPQYHDISDTPAAQNEARDRHLPLAYLGSFPECLTNGAPNPGSMADLTQMALAALQGNAVVIFFDGRNMAPVPAIIHAQYHIQDDGPLEGGAAWTSPKIVFANADISKILGRVSHQEMADNRDIPINSALQVIRNDPEALAPPPAASTPTPTPPAPDRIDMAFAFVSWIYTNGNYLILSLLALLGVIIFSLAKSRKT